MISGKWRKERQREKRNESGLVCLWWSLTLTSLHTSPYISIETRLCVFIWPLCSAMHLCSVDSVTYECYDINESFPPPSPPPSTTLSFLSFSSSAPISSSGLYKLAMSTVRDACSNMAFGHERKPRNRCFSSQSSVSDLKSAHFAELDLTPGSKKIYSCLYLFYWLFNGD